MEHIWEWEADAHEVVCYLLGQEVVRIMGENTLDYRCVVFVTNGFLPYNGLQATENLCGVNDAGDV